MAADEFVDWYMKLEVDISEWGGTPTVSLNKYMMGADVNSERARARNAVFAAAKGKTTLAAPKSLHQGQQW